MNWFGWLLIAWFGLSALLVVKNVGKPRTPTEPATAALVVLLAASFIVGLLTVGTGR